jgi:hypothetical protein
MLAWRVPPLPWPALEGAPRAAGFAPRILGYGHRRLDRSGWRLVRLSDLQPPVYSLPPVPPPSMPSAFGRHPGAAAVIPAVVHARRAFGLCFFPRCQWSRSLRCQPHSSRWNVNSGSAGRGDSFASATHIRPALYPAKIAAASCRRRVKALRPLHRLP